MGLKEVKKCADFVGLFYENRIDITRFLPTNRVTIPLLFHVRFYPDTSSSFRAMKFVGCFYSTVKVGCFYSTRLGSRVWSLTMSMLRDLGVIGLDFSIALGWI